MSPIEEGIEVRHLGKDKWLVIKDYTFNHPVYGEIVVPEGFVTDFASVPPLPLAYTLTKNATREGAAVHDMLYRYGRIGDRRISKAEADRIMNDVMIEEGVPWWKRRMIMTGLAVGGWCTWRRYRRAEKRANTTGAG